MGVKLRTKELIKLWNDFIEDDSILQNARRWFSYRLQNIEAQKLRIFVNRSWRRYILLIHITLWPINLPSPPPLPNGAKIQNQKTRTGGSYKLVGKTWGGGNWVLGKNSSKICLVFVLRMDPSIFFYFSNCHRNSIHSVISLQCWVTYGKLDTRTLQTNETKTWWSNDTQRTREASELNTCINIRFRLVWTNP